jgi:hypothetical protein
MAICTACFNNEYQTITIEKEVVGNVECEKCPSCGDIVFTHQQSLALDKKRIESHKPAKRCHRCGGTLDNGKCWECIGDGGNRTP